MTGCGSVPSSSRGRRFRSALEVPLCRRSLGDSCWRNTAIASKASGDSGAGATAVALRRRAAYQGDVNAAYAACRTETGNDRVGIEREAIGSEREAAGRRLVAIGSEREAIGGGRDASGRRVRYEKEWTAVLHALPQRCLFTRCSGHESPAWWPSCGCWL